MEVWFAVTSIYIVVFNIQQTAVSIVVFYYYQHMAGRESSFYSLITEVTDHKFLGENYRRIREVVYKRNATFLEGEGN